WLLFFFQAEDGIRDDLVTGVQTCALPISGETVVWMDGLDVPLAKALDCIFFEMYRERQVPATKPVNGSQAMYGHGRLSPTWMKEVSKISPQLLYSWEQTTEARHPLRDRDAHPH